MTVGAARRRAAGILSTGSALLARRAVVALLLAGVAGCGMRTLRRDLAVTRELASIEGAAEIRGGASEPVVVVAADAAGEVIDLFLLARPGRFFLTLPAGTYRIGAFEDLSRDLTYQPDSEPAVLLGSSGEIVLEPGERRRDVELVIDAESATRLPLAVNALAGEREISWLPALQIGTIADLDDARFATENGELGLWEPLRFMYEVGGGVYFLEPYDPRKIPILFVHGATGTPANWKFLADKIDRSRFQPWFAYYPAAAEIGRAGAALLRALSSLRVAYRFERMVLVAHSMGGLVTRAALNAVARDETPARLVEVPLFVSLATPWGGVASAELGVKYAPVVAPMWRDMAPGSEFLRNLPQTPLPPGTDHALLFAYRSPARRSREANDGTVTLASELSMPIQRQAAYVMGFDETHASILESAEVAEKLNRMLARVAP